jgi:Tol biopolymer transport system component/predicted amidohydrolase
MRITRGSRASIAILAHLPVMLAVSLHAGIARDQLPVESVRPRQTPGQTLPLKPTRRIAFDTDEGTWMSVDLAPDGKTLVFDLLGDLYTLDANGGRARQITRGMGFDTQPVFSPDGGWVAFVSDRSGAENIWVARPDGSEARQMSFVDDDTVLVSPEWSVDGRSLFVSRFRYSLDGYELWRYDLKGREDLIVPVKTARQPRDQWPSSLGAAPSPDGRYVYFSRRRGGPDSIKVDEWTIVRREIATGAEEVVIADQRPRGSTTAAPYFRPVLSPDGKLLAYATRYAGRTGLRLRDLASGDDRWLAFPVEHDQIQANSWQDLLPRYCFTRDSNALILSRGGKLQRLDITSGVTTAIPFDAHVDVELGPLIRVAIAPDEGPVEARLIQTPEQSPDGKLLAFSALGHVFVMSLDGTGTPRRVTDGDAPEFHPSWSPDGNSIVYVTWSAKGNGHVWVVPLKAGVPRRITETPAFYTSPVFTGDGTTILVVKSANMARMRTTLESGKVRNADLIALPVPGGRMHVVKSGMLGGKPHFGPDPGTVMIQLNNGIGAVDLATGQTKSVTTVTGPGWYFQDGPVPVNDSRLSPDGKWILAQVAQQLHLVAAPASGSAAIDLSNPSAPHRRLTDVGADFFEWADGGRTITWAVGSSFYRRSLGSVALNAPNRADWTADAPASRAVAQWRAVVQAPRDTPHGSIMLTGARVITMQADRVIEDADLIVTDGRIAAIGPRGSLAAPAATVVRDVAGKTIVPGFIDMHDHVGDIRRDVLDMAPWGLAARLAYGITTVFDPSSLSIDMFAYEDLIDAGIITGSRLFTTGTALFSFNRLGSADEARRLLSRYRDHYRTRNVKQYLIGNRRARQWVAQAAAEYGLMPTTEGSLALKLDLSQIMDGFSGHEHALPTPLHKDVIEFVARSRTSYDATLQIKNGGAGAQDDFVVTYHPNSDPKFNRFRPHSVVDASTLTRQWTDPATLLFPRLAGDVARILRAGGLVGMGSHGEIPGVGLHWEMEAHVMGGMTPMEALRAGTLGSAEAIGRSVYLGSLEPGKMADLVILDADPRDDIRNTRATALVMKNGRLYDAASLDEIWPLQRSRPAPWFADDSPPDRPY